MSIILSGDNGVTFPNSTVQASAGSVLQVVNATYATTVSSSTSTLVDTGLTATITPKFSTSKILVIVNQNAIAKAGSTATTLYVQRNGTNIAFIGTNIGYTATTASNYTGSSGNICYLDSPATISSTVYKTQFCSNANIATVVVQESNGTSTMTLMEIAA